MIVVKMLHDKAPIIARIWIRKFELLIAIIPIVLHELKLFEQSSPKSLENH